VNTLRAKKWRLSVKVGDLVNWIAKDSDGIIKWTRVVLYLGDLNIKSKRVFAKIAFQGEILTVNKKMLQPIE